MARKVDTKFPARAKMIAVSLNPIAYFACLTVQHHLGPDQKPRLRQLLAIFALNDDIIIGPNLSITGNIKIDGKSARRRNLGALKPVITKVETNVAILSEGPARYLNLGTPGTRARR